MNTLLRNPIVLFITCLQFSSIFSQNAAPYWSTSGNSNATTSSKLGTTNSIPLRLLTNNTERMRLDVDGKVGIGTTAPKGKLSIQSSGSAPASLWVTSGVPIFAGFGENTAGNADDILAMASNAANARAVFLGRRSRGTLALPTAVQNNDYLMSIFASGYDGGGTFQSPATLDFFVDGTVSSGKVPTRVSISTGSSFSDRTERLKVGSTGNVDINDGQLFVQQANGFVGIGTTSPNAFLDVISPESVTSVLGHGFTAIEGDGIGSLAYGVFGHSNETNGVGVVGNASNNVGVYGIGNVYAGKFIGNVYSSGTYTGSDAKLKQHITKLDSALDIINKLQPQTYQFRQDGTYKLMNLPMGHHYGLIAQDLEKVLPDMVKETSFDPAIGNPDRAAKRGADVIDFKAVNYTELIPILVKAVQELEQRNKHQDSTIQVLQQQLANLTGTTSATGIGMLGQNTPNPAGQLTNVSYQVPATTRQAYIAVIDNAGRLLQNIRVSGSGVARINTSGLTGGVYHYSLIADNRVVDTKQLLIAR